MYHFVLCYLPAVVENFQYTEQREFLSQLKVCLSQAGASLVEILATRDQLMVICSSMNMHLSQRNLNFSASGKQYTMTKATQLLARTASGPEGEIFVEPEHLSNAQVLEAGFGYIEPDQETKDRIDAESVDAARIAAQVREKLNQTVNPENR